MNLDYTSIYPYFVIMAINIAVGALIVRYVPFYKKMAEVQESGRYEVLDGLRGILAFGVFFQHAVTNYTYFQTGVWEITTISFYRHVGGESVILFFILTSFLYWSKAIAKKGEIDMTALYKNRILRLAPMYLFSASIVTIIALFITEFDIHSFSAFAREILSWLSLGLITTLHVNDLSIVPINAGIHWTLHFEWVFYLLLPITAIVLKNSLMRLLVIPYLAVIALAPKRGYWMIFLFGVAAAHLASKYPKADFFRQKWAAIIPIGGLLLIYLIQNEPYSIPQYFITLIVFISFVYGNDLLGLLKTKTAKFLGSISYSVYLLHGIVLFLILHAVDSWYPITTLSPISFWSLIAASSLIVLGIASVTYIYIEYPFLTRIKLIKQKTPLTLNEKVM